MSVDIPRGMATVAMTARFDGACANCGERIAAGDRMRWSRAARWAWHPDCETVLRDPPPDERPRTMTARFDGRCANCGEAIRAGDPIQYRRPSAFHLACPAEAAPDPEQTDLDLSVLPYGTYRFAAEDATGELRFVRVDLIPETDEDGRPRKWGGNIYVTWASGGRLGRQVKGSRYAGREAVTLRNVLADPAAAARRYGLEIGECSVCARGLTDPESRANGIGPVCGRRFTWTGGRVRHEPDEALEGIA